MRRKSALLLGAAILALIMPLGAIAQTQPPETGSPAYDPAIEQRIRQVCNAECFTAVKQCRSDNQTSQSPCDTLAITCNVGCRTCVSAYRECRTDTPASSHEMCLRREFSCSAEQLKNQEGRTDLIRFTGGDGTSVESAVVIEGARNEQEGVTAEGYWQFRNRPGWEKGDQALIKSDTRQWDRITYISPQGVEAIIFFDITGFFGKD